MKPNNAYISLRQVAVSWLLGRGKTRHSLWKALRYGIEAVRELSLSSLPIVQNKILTKPEGQPYFDIPSDYLSYTNAGTHKNGAWKQVAISRQLLPFLQTSNGAFKSWGDIAAITADFWEADFSGDDFAIVNSLSQKGATHTCRNDEIVIAEAQGIIICNPLWKNNELYFQYVSVGTADTVTEIPVLAQAAIEAYISWKWAEAKRNNSAEAVGLHADFDRQHAWMRARLNDLGDVETIRRGIFFGYEGLLDFCVNDDCNTVASTPVVHYSYFNIQDTHTMPTEEEILTWPVATLSSAETKAVLWTNTTDKYLLFAYPATDNDPTTYYISQFDNGTLGDDGTFGIPTVDGGGNFKVITSNYPTTIPTTVTFL